MKKSLINGIASEYLSVYDRATHYGDGVFETILCQANQLYYWQAHYHRLVTSAEKLKLHCPTENVVLADIRKLLNDKNLDTNLESNDNCYSIKIILTRGVSERGYRFPDNKASNCIILLSVLDASYSSIASNKLLEGDLVFCEQQVSINKQLAGLKHLNRLDNVMALNELSLTSKGNNILDGLMLNNHQHVIEGCMSNIFAVKNNELITPDLSLSGVNGIMRQVIIDMTGKLDIKLSIRDLVKNDLLIMDELFISNSLIGIKSVTGLDSSKYDKPEITKLVFKEILNTMKHHAHAV